MVSFMSDVDGSPSTLRSGDGRRVGGAVNRSMSIMIEDLRRMAGSNARILRAVVGLGGAMRSWVA